MADNPFTRHPNEVGESYAGHFLNASAFALRMFVGSIAVLIHAIFPFLFVQTGSRTMDKLHRRMARRSDRVNWERHPII